MHTEEAKIMPRAQPGNLQLELGQGRVWFLDDLVNLVHVGAVVKPAAGERAVLVNQMLAGGLHGRDSTVFRASQVQQLTGTAALFAGNVEVVAQKEQERRSGNELARAPDRVAVAFRLRL